MSDLIEREYLLNIARKEEAYGYVSEHEILNAPNAETTGALDDAIQEYIKDGYILAEPKMGEWIETSEGTMCSNCHKFPYDDGEYHIANWHSDFCPNCGAKLEGGEW